MKLPEKFQMRDVDHPGFTHVVIAALDRDYKRTSKEFVSIKWARGYFEEVGYVLNKLVRISDLVDEIKGGRYVIVDDKPEQQKQEEALPDVVYVEHTTTNSKYLLKKVGVDDWRIYDLKGVPLILNYRYSEAYIAGNLANEVWKLLGKKPLTPEQQRFNKEFRERIFALNNSIKIQQQTVEHHQRMIANYEDQIKDLEAKIVGGDE